MTHIAREITADDLTQGDQAAALPRLGPDADPQMALALLKEHGVLIIENAMSLPRLTRLRAELEPWFQNAFHGDGAFFGRSTRRFSGLFAKSRSAVDLAIDPLVLPVMDGMLKGDGAQPACDTIELNLTQAIAIEPGEAPQFLHRDEDLWPFANTTEIMANAMWVLDDFTVENGATRVIPGSHRWPRDRDPQPGEAMSATAPAGSVILWLGGVLHGGGANTSSRARRGLVISYRLGWLAPAEKLLLSIPPEVARQLPEALQRLIGYQLHRPNLGWVEGQDPIGWLRREYDELAPTQDNLTAGHQALLADVTANPNRYLGFLS